MKKILSILMCFSMLMSSVVFAAPTNFVDIEDTTEKNPTSTLADAALLAEYTLSFASGTASTAVVGLPAAQTVSGTVDLSTFAQPTREGFGFIGWTLDADDGTIVDSVDMTEDTTVYAVWAKGYFEEFESGKGLLKIERASNVSTADGTYTFDATIGGVMITMNKNRASGGIVNADQANILEIRYASTKANLGFTTYFVAEKPDGSGYYSNNYKDGDTSPEAYVNSMQSVTGSNSASLNDYTVVRIDMSNCKNWKGIVSHIRMDLGTSAGSTTKIDYIRVYKAVKEVVKVADVTEPVAMAQADTTATVTEGFEVKSVEWDGELYLGKYFNKYTEYTAKVTLEAKVAVSDNVFAYMNGKEATAVTNADGTITVSYKFTPTQGLKEVAVTANKSVTEITKNGIPMPLSATVAPVNTEDTIDDLGVVWTVSDDTIATVEDGKLVPLNNGVVTVFARSAYDKSKFDSFDVTITNQKNFNVTFDAATNDSVANLPEAIKWKNTLDLTSVSTPTRTGYVFLGWVDERGSEDFLSSVNVTDDITLYAVWASGFMYEYNVDGVFGYTVTNQGGVSDAVVKDGNLSFTSTAGSSQIQLNNNNYKAGGVLNANEGKVLEIRYASTKANVAFDVYFSAKDPVTDEVYCNGWINGDESDKSYVKNMQSATGQNPADINTYHTVRIDMSKSIGWKGAVYHLRIDFKAGAGQSNKIDYIRALTTEQSGVAIEGLGTPAAKAFAPKTATSSNAKVESVTWTPSLLHGEYFDGKKEYTAKVKVSPLSGKKFSNAVVGTIDGKEAQLVAVYPDGTAEFAYTYGMTDEIVGSTDVVSITLVAPEGESTRNIFVGDTYVPDESIIGEVETGYRFLGYGTTPNEPDTVVDEIVASEDTTLYAIYELITGYDFSNRHHQTDVKVVNATYEFKDGAMVLTATNKDSQFITDGFAFSTNDYAYVDFVVDSALSSDITVDSKPYVFFSLSNASGSFSEQRKIYPISAEKITEDGKDCVKFTFDLSAHDAWIGGAGSIRFDGCDTQSVWAVRSLKFRPYADAEAAINISGIKVPETWEKPSTSVDEISGYVVKSVTWNNDCLNEYGAFAPEKVATVTVTLKPVAGYKFNESKLPDITVNGDSNVTAVFDENARTVVVSYKFPKTNPLAEVKVNISGASDIVKDGRYEQYLFDVLANDGTRVPMSDVEVVISKIVAENGMTVAAKDYENYVLFDAQTGRLVPVSNCTITIRATSVYDKTKYAEKNVVITGQKEAYKVTYDLNTQDPTLTGSAPADMYIKGNLVLPECTAKRSGYFFAGWSTNKDAIEADDVINITKDTTIYALWATGYIEEFTSGRGLMEVNGNASNITTSDGTYTFDSISGVMAQMNKGRASGGIVNADQASILEIKYASTKANLGFTIYFVAEKPDGSGYYSNPYKDGDTSPEAYVNSMQKVTGSNSGSLDDYDVVRIDVSNCNNWKGIITHIRMDLSTATSKTKIDYIRIINTSRTVTIDANGGTLDEFGATTATKTVKIGDYNVPYTPQRTGYSFMGWCKDAVGAGIVDKKVTVSDACTIYAIWAIATDFSDASTVTTLDAGDAGKITAVADATGNGASITTSDSVAPVIKLTDGMVVSESNNTLIMKLDYNASSMEGNKIKLTFVDDSGNPVEVDVIPQKLAPVNGYSNTDANISSSSSECYFKAVIPNEYNGKIITNVNVVFPKAKYNSLNISDVTLTKEVLADANIINELTTGGVDFVDLSVTTGTGTGNLKTYAPIEQAEKVEGALGGEEQLGASVATNGNTTAGSRGSGSIKVDKVTTPKRDETSPPTDVSHFRSTRIFEVSTFSDIKGTDWFYLDVAKSYELGLMEGRGNAIFDPNGAVTVAEAVTVAARIYEIASKSEKKIGTAAEGDAWYKPYVDYAISSGIIKSDEYADYNAKATRSVIAQIFAKATPEGFLANINKFDGLIPDVKTTDAAYNAVLGLYNAGILTGVDNTYKFNPEAEIKRCELSAIINRIAMPASRIKVASK